MALNKEFTPMHQKRVHILAAVNAANVSKAGATYTIRDVCGAVDDIVLNGMLYPADQLKTGAPSLEGKPAPAGHPKNAGGQHISALNGEALASAWIGSYCTNARHEAGRTLVDVVVNEPQARASTQGAQLLDRLDAAIAGTSAEPIHVSTGLMVNAIAASGESRGKKYSRIATNLQYDHLAILIGGKGAGTPEEGVGMFLNSAGDAEQVEEVAVNQSAEDKRFAGLTGWIRKLLGNSSDLSFDQISEGLRAALPPTAWVREVYPRYVIWAGEDDKYYRQDYSVASDSASVALTSDPVEVIRKVEYETVTNHEEKGDTVKETILAALNAAGIAAAGLDDAQLLSAYNALTIKPHTDALVAANSKIAGYEVAANAAADAEITALATSLSVNSSLTIDDLKKLGLPRLKELKGTTAAAAPVVVGNAGAPVDEFAGYDLNSEGAAA